MFVFTQILESVMDKCQSKIQMYCEKLIKSVVTMK